jgi:4-amino-4-deoxy-L-arabinose transferase-like glycosyltransferase
MQYNHQKSLVFLLVAVLIVAFVLRTYHFGDWLHFELDQARDARVIDEGFTGNFFDLPLLGPKAGGTFLRLAPGFYYLEYLSGLLFGRDPVGIAFFVPILSFLTLPLLYLFLRRAFSRTETLGLLGIASVSVYLVLYGRFGWNPNLLPFFLVGGFYSLLRAVAYDEKHKTYWLLSAASSLILATHFHFLAFLAVPVIVTIFLFLKRPRFSWKAWIGVLAVGLFLYFPMILNEIEAGGTNTREFFGAITEKSNKEQHTLIEKTIRNVSEFGQNSVVILTGFEGATFPSVVVNDKEWGTVCDKKCDEGKWYGVLGVFFFFFGLLSLLRGWWAAHSRQISDFYLLSIIWISVSFLLYLPLSYAIAPRFYLLSAPLFFVMLGSIFQNIIPLKEHLKILLFVSTIGLLVVSNLYFLKQRFSELSQAATIAVDSAPDRILKERVRVTLEQQEKIVAYLRSRQIKSGYPVYMFSEPQHRRALKYLMERSDVQNDVLGFSGVYEQGEYYLILRSAENLEERLSKYLTTYNLIKIYPFGTLSVVELYPKKEFIQGVRQDFMIIEKKADSKAPPRYTWREFLDRQNMPTEEEIDGVQGEEESN